MEKLENDRAVPAARKAKLLEVLADTYSELGLYDQELDLRKKLVGLLAGSIGAAAPETLDARHRLGGSLIELGYHSEAVALCVESAALAEEEHGAEDLATVRAKGDLANAYLFNGQVNNARTTGEMTLASLRQNLRFREH